MIKNFLTGIIDEFAVWSRPLNVAEIISMAQAEGQPSETQNFNHIVIVTRWKKGFWNRVFFRTEQEIYVNGKLQVTWTIQKPSTMSWWSEK